MAMKYFHQLVTAISFGSTSGIITALGMIVGLQSATSSRLAVAAGIIVMAIADGLADAAGLHLSEESEIEGGKNKHTQKEVWITTFFTFLSVCGFILTFAVPLLLFQLETAVLISVIWGLLLLVALNLYIAKIKNEPPVKLVSEHILLALFVIVVSYLVGGLIGAWLE
jgi:VIT1/CCC1 family predicted Fe2+/Mn2+ transporter